MSKQPSFRARLEWLEDRRLLTISSTPNLTPPQTDYEDLVQSSVVGENIFYNDSSFDGNNPAANAADDSAIATDKTPLLPGQTATFANYTSYSRGINGVMVDILDLPGNLTANDFTFLVGNNSNTANWTPAAVAPTVTIRWGAGLGGSDRVELTWPNNAIQNEWLQVTVLANGDTGLTANIVFYYGNAIGETGNSPTDAQVSAVDLAAIEANPTVGAGITNVYDIDRDGSVNQSDVNIVAANVTTPAGALSLLAAPATVATTPYAAEQPAFLESTGPYQIFFAPQIIATDDGTLISTGEARTVNSDFDVAGMGETISTDGGQSWSAPITLYTVPNFPYSVGAIGTMVLDAKTNTVFFFFSLSDDDPMVMSTSNDGKTWTTPVDLTSSIMNPSWQWLDFGPGNGIQLTIGPDSGRLMVAFDYRYSNSNSVPSYDAVAYSDDDGATWQMGGGPDPTNSANAGANEASIVQLSTGAIYMNSRINTGTNTAPARAYSISDDGGITWTNVQYAYDLPVSSVEGSMIRLDANTLLFAAPDDVDNNSVRQQMTIWASFDDAQTWVKERVLNYEFASYSDMVALGNDTAMISFNVGQLPDFNRLPSKDELIKFDLASLLNGQALPVQFTYTFNEQPVGQSAPIGGSSIRDDGVWDQRGTVLSTGGTPYYIQGSNGNEALRIVNGSDVDLSPAESDGLQFGTGESFTFEFVLRTTSANGVLLGALPTDPGYTFSLVNGAITLNLNDGKNSVTITGSTIDDGNWHDVVGIRNSQTQTVSLYVDGQLVATAADPTGRLHNADDVMLGSYADGSSQLTFDIQLLQATRGVLTPGQFLTANYVAPQTLPAPTTPANGVLGLPGLAFFLGPYDQRHYFADPSWSDPLALQPAVGTSTLSAVDDTGKYEAETTSNGTIYYETDAVMGSYFSSQTGNGWTILNSNGTLSSAQNFDFVQNSENFTVSGVFNIPALPSSGQFTLIGNNQNHNVLSGFELIVDASGNLSFEISNGNGSRGQTLDNETLATFNGSNSVVPTLATSTWYQVVIVGNGPGTPVTYYLTPMTTNQVQQYQGTSVPTLGSPQYPSRGSENLEVARVSGDTTTTDNPIVNFNDVAIFNQALTPSQVEQLLSDESDPPTVTPSGTSDRFTAGGPAAAVDSALAIASQEASLSGATMTISPGTLQSGDALNFTNQSGISGSYNAASGTLTLSGSATPTQYQTALDAVTFSSTSSNTTTRDISVAVADNQIASNVATEQLLVDAPATITAVYVSGTTWAPTFMNYLGSSGLGNGTYGYALKTGGAQLNTLPFNNVNTIDIQFSGPVSGVSTSSLELVGGIGPGAAAAPTVTGLNYLGNDVYQWTLSGPLGNNKYAIAVASTGSSFGPAVVDANGAGISGSFVTSSSSFPSGNGLAGSTFVFFFDVLPGDGNQNGTVSSTDTAVVKQQVNKRSTQAGYDVYYDYNGQGVINTIDVAIDGADVNSRQSTITAPAAPAAARVGGANFSALALGVQESNQTSSGTSRSAMSNFSATAVSTTSAGAGSKSVSETGSPASIGSQRMYGRHAFAAADHRATDAALVDFDPADLWA